MNKQPVSVRSLFGFPIVRGIGRDYTIPQVDLSAEPDGIQPLITVDGSRPYLGHPDSILTKTGEILTFFPAGHGRGAVLGRISADEGRNWHSLENTPKSWEKSRETPTVYRLEFADAQRPDQLILISANTDWPGDKGPGGFNCSLSADEGKTWSEFECFYEKNSAHPVVPIVAMSALTRLKENGRFVYRWLGIFHDKHFINYRTILTFDGGGRMHWSPPEPYFSTYRAIEKGSKMCEVEMIRSDGGQGDELCLITRSQTKKVNSLISFSQDEGKTWSTPRELPAALNGERHKAEWTKDGRLFITFRSIERSPDKNRIHQEKGHEKRGWYSEGWIAWVGTYDDLKQGREGQYRIKIAHTYLDGQTAPEPVANGDTGYCGNIVLEDGTIFTCTYGRFGDTYQNQEGKSALRTYIASRRINLAVTDRLAAK